MLRKGKKVSCKKCDVTFYITPSECKRDRKYCSMLCARNDKFGRKKEKNCKTCLKTFIANTTRGIGYQKFCSKNCYNYFPIKYKCNECSVVFSGIQRDRRKFCSKECMFSNYRRVRLGKGNPAFRTGLYTKNGTLKKTTQWKHLQACKNYKDAFIAKYGYQFCEVCGTNKNGTARFEVHHIYYASRYPKHKNLHDPRNLIHICIKCHNGFHGGLLEEKFIQIEKERGLKELFKQE